MSLYDTYQQANNGYTSQYTGNILPELNQYSNIVQQRYNTAADSDDALSEALGNLGHLGLDADTKYANELKQQYYQKLIDRSQRGDFENMGRRTRRDAIDFSNAYQPLVQRQTDLSAIIKGINADDKIADPDKKAQIIDYIKHINDIQPDPVTGDFQRDGSGKIQLGAIQNWQYSKDVDIDKKIADMLSKKEADIRQGNYVSDGKGLKISSIDKFRDPKVMAGLAQQFIQNDPEIQAMLKRDTLLKNYKLSDDEVTQQLSPMAVSEYDRLKRKGLSPQDIGAHLKSEGYQTNEQAKLSPLQRKQNLLISGGMGKAQANRAILNDQTTQDMVAPHVQALSGLLGYHQHTIDARDDSDYNLKAQAALMDASKNLGDFHVTTQPTSTLSQVDPEKMTTDYVAKNRLANEAGSNLQASTLAAMKLVGISTGNPKKDIAMAIEFSNDPNKMNILKDRIVTKNPELAGNLETTQQKYLNVKDQLAYTKANVEALEQAGGINTDKLYKDYVNSTNHAKQLSNLHIDVLNKNDFIEAIRDKDSKAYGTLSRLSEELKGNDTRPLQKYADMYNDLVNKGAKAMKDGTTQAAGYHTIDPMSSGKIKNITDYLNNAAKSGDLQLTPLGSEDTKPQSLANIMKLDQTKANTDTKSDDYKTLNGTSIALNREFSASGKPTLTIKAADGSVHTVVANNLSPEMVKNLQTEMYQSGTKEATKGYASEQTRHSIMGLGSSHMNITEQDLDSRQPSSVHVPINDDIAVQVKPGGPNGKRYEVFFRGPNGDQSTGKFYNSATDIVQGLGINILKNNTAPKVLNMINTK